MDGQPHVQFYNGNFVLFRVLSSKRKLAWKATKTYSEDPDMIVMDEFPNDFFSGPLETPEDLNGPNKEFSREFRVRKIFGILNTYF